jgi:hypothetical protein
MADHVLAYSERPRQSQGREGQDRGPTEHGRGRPGSGPLSRRLARHQVLRWFILVVALLLDPAAVLLLLAATRTRS